MWSLSQLLTSIVVATRPVPASEMPGSHKPVLTSEGRPQIWLKIHGFHQLRMLGHSLSVTRTVSWLLLWEQWPPDGTAQRPVPFLPRSTTSTSYMFWEVRKAVNTNLNKEKEIVCACALFSWSHPISICNGLKKIWIKGWAVQLLSAPLQQPFRSDHMGLLMPGKILRNRRLAWVPPADSLRSQSSVTEF